MSKSTEVRGKGITPGRYTLAADGEVFDLFGGHYISRDLWERRLAEGRSDRARHEFRYVDRPRVSIGQGWFLDHVECGTCGETREVGVSVDELNRQERWCMPRGLRKFLEAYSR